MDHRTFFDRTVDNLQTRIKALYPQTLDGETMRWGRENRPELVAEIDRHFKEAEALLASGAAFDDFKAAVLAWGRKQLELFKIRHEVIQGGQLGLAI